MLSFRSLGSWVESVSASISLGSVENVILLKIKATKSLLALCRFFYFCSLLETLAHGVTGNTSVFGTEESRFEP